MRANLTTEGDPTTPILIGRWKLLAQCMTGEKRVRSYLMMMMMWPPGPGGEGGQHRGRGQEAARVSPAVPGEEPRV